MIQRNPKVMFISREQALGAWLPTMLRWHVCEKDGGISSRRTVPIDGDRERPMRLESEDSQASAAKSGQPK